MLHVRRSADRGHADHGWLRSYHSFSFADYFDPRFMGFRALRVINEDRVQPGRGFGTHGHRDMEIVSWVIDGALEHRDSLGTGSVIRPGELQRMSAGSGIQHSEFNASKEELVHFLQIWIIPAQVGIKPSYEQIAYDGESRLGRLLPVATPDGAAGTVTIHQDARILASALGRGTAVSYAPPAGRYAWLQLYKGDIEVNGLKLAAGDGLAVEAESLLSIQGASSENAEFLLFDLA
jgi:redox-sensitive bicupin YhaK (pirin superfamily)